MGISPNIKGFRSAPLAFIGVLICIGAAAAVWFGFANAGTARPARMSLVPPVSLQAPLPLGHLSTLADAASKLGTAIPLPSATSGSGAQVSASSVGSVWVQQDDGGADTNVAVTFPSAGLIVQYERPVPYPQAPAAMYQAEAKQFPNLMSVTDLNGVPALVTTQNSDQTGANFGAIEFVVSGTRVAVLGRYDTATLRTFAAPLLAAAAG